MELQFIIIQTLFYSSRRLIIDLNDFVLFPAMILDLTRFSFSFLSTGFFFLLSWSLFTYQHREEISQDLSSLGSSYWLGAIGWFLLLVMEMIVFVAEQAVVPDILPDLEKAVESWRISSQLRTTTLSCSDSYNSAYSPSDMYPQRFVSAAL